MNAPITISRELAGWLQGQMQAGVALVDIRAQLSRVTQAPPEVLDRLCRALERQHGSPAHPLPGPSPQAHDATSETRIIAGPQAQHPAFQATHPLRWDGQHRVRVMGQEIDVLTRLARPAVAVLGNVLSDRECRDLIAFAKDRVAPAQVVDPATGQDYHDAARSSELVMCQRDETPLITRIEQRITALCGIPESHGEGLQIMRYGPGAEYRPHFDFFRNTGAGEATHLRRGGQRIATMVMYLNDGARGGETVFPEVGLQVAPVQGHAVYFAYTDADGACDSLSLHGGAPVTAGEKWIATKWFRQREYI